MKEFDMKHPPRSYSIELITLVIEYLSLAITLGLAYFIYIVLGAKFSLVFILLFMYLTFYHFFIRISKVTVGNDTLYLNSLLRRRAIPFKLIKKMRVSFDSYRGSRNDFVLVELKEKRGKYKLKHLGVKPDNLLIALRKLCK